MTTKEKATLALLQWLHGIAVPTNDDVFDNDTAANLSREASHEFMSISGLVDIDVGHYELSTLNPSPRVLASIRAGGWNGRKGATMKPYGKRQPKSMNEVYGKSVAGCTEGGAR